MLPSALVAASFFGGDGAPADATDVPHLVQRLITLEELACAKGHVYPLLLVRLALTWVCEAHTSYRGIALIFASLRGLVAAMGPCAETIRLWLLRVGLFLLRQPLPRYSDWVFLVDLTIQLGTHKCLVILGVPLSQLRRTGYSPDHHDVYVLSLQVLTRCTGTLVSGHLSTVSKRVGMPVQIVSDHGGDVVAGIRLFRQKNRHSGHVVETYDISHGLALLLKKQLEPDPCWTRFVTACQHTRQQLQQTAGSFLQPPAWRCKARFLNLESHLKWANDMLALLCGDALGTLAKQLGRSEAETKQWLQEKLGWLREYADAVKVWSYFQRVVKDAEEEIKRRGLSRTSWRRIKRHLSGDSRGRGQERSFRRQVLAFVKKEGAKVPVRQRYLGSTDVLESLFGKYKDLAEQAPSREITANVLTIPLLVTALTPELLRQALETVREQDVEQWLEEHLGPPQQKKKRVVLNAAGGRDTKEDPKPA
jgi:hypothetical protein